MTASHAKSSSVSSSLQDMFIYDVASVRVAAPVSLQLVDPLLQFLDHSPQDHRELLIVQSQQLFWSAHGLAQDLAQLPGGLNVLGDEAKLVLASADPVVVLRLHGIEELLDVLVRHAPDVRLEPPVRGIQVPIAENHLPVQGPAGVGLDGQIGEAVRVVHRDELEEAVQLHAPARQRLQLGHAVLVVGVQQQRRLARGRGIPHHHPDGAVGGPHCDLLQQRAEHLHAAGAARQTQERQRGLGGEDPVDAQGVVHEHSVGAALDREQWCRRVAAHQRGLHPQIALDLLRGRDGAAARKGSGGCRGAHEELGEIPRGCVEGPVRPDGDVLLQAYAAGREAGQQCAVFGTDGGGGVLDLKVRGSTLQHWRVHDGGREAVDRQVCRGIHSGGVLQVRDTLPQGVEVGDEGIAGVALALGPAVTGDLQGAAVAQDGLGGEGRLAEQVPDDVGGELGLGQVENPTSFGAGSGDEVAGVQRPEVVGPQEAGICFGLGPLRMRRVDWLPRIASPTSGASRSRFLTMRGVNCSCTKFQIWPDSAPGARTR